MNIMLLDFRFRFTEELESVSNMLFKVYRCLMISVYVGMLNGHENLMNLFI